MPELQCHYYRAKLALGERDAAFEGAADLWNVGQSQERACDPLFEAWIAAGGPSDALVWSRALKAFDAKNGHLIRYVKRFASEPLQRDLDELAAVYRRPSRVEGDHHQATDRHADILVAGVGRLAQLSPARAYQSDDQCERRIRAVAVTLAFGHDCHRASQFVCSTLSGTHRLGGRAGRGAA